MAFVIAYWLVLSCLPKYSERYFLPVLLGNVFFVALGADSLAQSLGKCSSRWNYLLRGLAWVLVLALLLPSAAGKLLQMEKAFRQDSRFQLAEWIPLHLPEGSLIAQDDLVRLEALTGEKYSCLSSEFVPDLGSIAELKKKGVRYVAICRRSHFPYTEPGLLAANRNTDEFIRRRDFYLAVLQQGKILWNAADHDPKMLHPGITLIDISGIESR